MNDTKPFGVEITLSDVCKNITYGYTASATSENTGVKFLRITDIVPSRIDWESVPFCKISPSDLDKYQIREGDIVIARTGATTGYNKTIMMCAELAGDFHLGDSRQLTNKSLLPFDLVS